VNFALDGGARGVKKNRPGTPGPLQGPACDASPLTPASQTPNETRSAKHATAVRYHRCRLVHSQTCRQTSPAVNHLRDNHRQRDHRANNQNQIMRRLENRSAVDSHRTLPERLSQRRNTPSQDLSSQDLDRQKRKNRINLRISQKGPVR